MKNLNNTYIENDGGELLTCYLIEAEKQGFKVEIPHSGYGSVGIVSCSTDYEYVQIEEEIDSTLKQITLSDLKPQQFLQTGEAFEHTKTLNFILNRMIKVHGEHESVDYIHKLRNAIVFVESAESPKQKIEHSKPRVKVEYVKVDKNAENGAYWECARDFANGVVFVVDSYSIKDNETLLGEYVNGNLYRKVEREVTWQDEVIEQWDDGVTLDTTVRELMEMNEQALIGMCHLVTSITGNK